jgi:hypothetical protein
VEDIGRGVNKDGEEFGKNVGDALHRDGDEMRNVLFHRAETRKEGVDDVGRAMEEEHEFPRLVVISIQIGRSDQRIRTGSDIVDRYTHRHTMDSGKFFIISERETVETALIGDPLHGELFLETSIDHLVHMGLICLECLGDGKLGVSS